ncbi:MAG: ribonuclease P protein component [Planctomycetota bacterium]|nr:ribonuclease P protein component [Planctomycetota bacterium]
MAESGFRFRRAQRLRKSSRFDRVFARGRAFRTPLLTVCAIPNGMGMTRMGISVGRRFGDAVRRNKVKRMCREAFRLAQHELPRGLDLVIIPRPGVECRSVAEIRDALNGLAPKLKTLFGGGQAGEKAGTGAGGPSDEGGGAPK